MNSKRFAQMRISPLHIQQMLFATLAVLVTLIAIQQFQRWDNNRAAMHEATQIKQQFTYSQSYTTASAPLARDTALSFTPVEGTASVSEMPQQQNQQSWVF